MHITDLLMKHSTPMFAPADGGDGGAPAPAAPTPPPAAAAPAADGATPPAPAAAAGSLSRYFRVLPKASKHVAPPGS